MKGEIRTWQGPTQPPDKYGAFRLINGKRYDVTMRKRKSGKVRVDIREFEYEDKVTLFYDDEEDFKRQWAKPGKKR